MMPPTSGFRPSLDAESMPRRRFAPAEDADFVGMGDAVEKVTNWLEEKTQDSESDVRVILKPLGIGESTSIGEWTLAAGEPAGPMAEMIVDQAMDDGRGARMRGPGRYVVEIKGQKSRCTFVLDYPSREDDDLEELPDPRGVVHQVMRQNEQLHKSQQEMLGLMVKQMRDITSDYRARADASERLFVENAKMYSEMLDHKHEREIEMRKLNAAEARKDEFAGFLMQAVPHIVNKVIGGGGAAAPAPSLGPVPAKKSPSEMHLEAFVSRLTPEQLNKVVQTGQLSLSPDQVFGFVEILKTVMEQQGGGAPPTAADEPASPNGEQKERP